MSVTLSAGLDLRRKNSHTAHNVFGAFGHARGVEIQNCIHRIIDTPKARNHDVANVQSMCDGSVSLFLVLGMTLVCFNARGCQ
jgi:hypothetical protein